MSFDKIKKLWPIIPLGLIVFAATWTMFAPFPLWGHSAGVDATRLFEMDRGIRIGELYPRWFADLYHGYGSPLFSMYAPLAYYVAEIFRLGNLPLTLAMKLSYLAAVLLAACGMFLLVRKHAGAPAGIAAAALYVLAPYFLADLFVRSAAAELFGFATAPWVFFFLAQYPDTGRTRDLGMAAFAYGALGIAHNISALIMTPLIVLYILVIFPPRDWIKGAFVIFVGLAMSAFFWLPALGLKSAVQSEKHLTTGYFSYARHFVPPGQLFLPRWGYDAPGTPGGAAMSLQLGIVHWALIILGAVVIAVLKEARKIFGPFLAMSLIALFFTQEGSTLLWTHLPLLKFVQFPWRFLLPATFGATVLSAALFVPVKKRFGAPGQTLLAAALCGAAFLAYFQYAQAHFLLLELPGLGYTRMTAQEARAAEGNGKYITFDEFMNVGNVLIAGLTGAASDDYLPQKVLQKPAAPAPQPFTIMAGDGVLTGQKSEFDVYSADVQAAEPLVLNLAVFNFPGFTATVDRRSVPIQTRPIVGTILFKVPEGKHHVKVRYEGAFIHKISDLVSFIGLLIGLRMVASTYVRSDLMKKTGAGPA